ncbi:MAG: hypothetical protein HZB46_04925 [Solirubrobacterales bacterium]|nr:hypothetical protein [Solirubrobacterales bacterium]
MSSLRRALFALFAAAVVVAAILAALTLTSDHEPDKAIKAVLGPFIGLSFVGTGVFAWLRRPHNRFGALMTGVGFAWFVAGLTVADDPFVHTLAVYLSPVYLVLVGHMLLAFPGGHLEGTAARTLIAMAYVDMLVVLIPFFLLGGEVFMLTVGFTLLDDLLGADTNTQDLPGLLSLITFAGLPYAFLLGLLRSQVSRAGAVGELIERLNTGGGGGASLREALAEALADRSLDIAYWSRQGERYVDADGQPVELPAVTRHRSRAVTEIEREGEPVAAIVHDVALLDEPGLVRAAGAAAALALENERLEAELKARVHPRRRARGAGLGAGGAARARARHPPGGPDRPRAGRRARGAGRPGARPGRAGGRPGGAPADLRGGRRVLRRGRVADQHRALRRRRACGRPGSQGEWRSCGGDRGRRRRGSGPRERLRAARPGRSRGCARRQA